MGFFEGDEEKKYRKLFVPVAAGAVIFVLGLILLVFGRGYGSDGTNYDLFIVFGTFFLIIGFLVSSVPLLLQLKILFKGIKRDDPGNLTGYVPAQSAAGQIMRTTQIFSSAPPSTYEGPHVMQPQQQRYNQPNQFSSAAGPYASGSMDRIIEAQGSPQQPLPNLPAYGFSDASKGNVNRFAGKDFKPEPQFDQYVGHSSEI